jgi:YfiH family protein
MQPFSLRVADRVVHVRCSTVRDGDFHIESHPVALAHRRQAFAPGRWTQLDEVHGVTVHHVRAAGDFDGAVGDAVHTRCAEAVLSVWVGDCAPVVLVGDDGAIGVAHAGWRGALDGVLQATVTHMAAPGVRAWLGPCIGPCCYEFGDDDLEVVVGRYGPQVAGRTSWGTPSLDMRAVVAAALSEVGVTVDDRSQCTRCASQHYFSHRRGQRERHVMTVRAMVTP